MMSSHKRILYLDCSLGVSGDMLLGALATASEQPMEALELLRSALQPLELHGLKLELTQRNVGGLATWQLIVDCSDEQPMRTIADITKVMKKSACADTVLRESIKTLTLLGETESFVHGCPIAAVHFHEIGAVDTIVDILGTHLLLEHLRIVEVVASPINLGSGFVDMAHGKLPVPAPAVAALAHGMEVFGSDLGMEAATPTGMVLIKRIAMDYGPLPAGKLVSVGSGCGGRSSDKMPTMLRAFILERGRREIRAHKDHKDS